LLWNGISGKVEYFAKGGKDWETILSSSPDRDYTYTEEIKSFFSSIESNGLPCISGDDGMHVVSIIEAIKKSSNTNSIVYLQT
jgi:predicted dehydrogenase